MRERQSSDWVIDLNGRHGIEAQVEHALSIHPTLTLLKASTTSFDRLDFQVLSAGEQLVQVELKAKRQPLSKGWRDLRPEVRPEDLFVLDELALRKIVDAGRYAFLLVRDVPTARWVLWTVGDLLVASRAATPGPSTAAWAPTTRASCCSRAASRQYSANGSRPLRPARRTARSTSRCASQCPRAPSK